MRLLGWGWPNGSLTGFLSQSRAQQETARPGSTSRLVGSGMRCGHVQCLVASCLSKRKGADCLEEVITALWPNPRVGHLRIRTQVLPQKYAFACAVTQCFCKFAVGSSLWLARTSQVLEHTEEGRGPDLLIVHTFGPHGCSQGSVTILA